MSEERKPCGHDPSDYKCSHCVDDEIDAALNPTKPVPDESKMPDYDLSNCPVCKGQGGYPLCPTCENRKPALTSKTLLRRTLLVASCNCMTKTPEVKHHAESCRYRIASEMIDDLASKDAELEELRAWKEAALQVELEWDAQAVGNLLGIKLGQSIRKGIEPGIRRLQQQLADIESLKGRLQGVKWNSLLNGYYLMVDGRCAATVWSNGVWHTWDEDGVGGENSSEKTVAEAKAEALLSALTQGFLFAARPLVEP